MSFLKRLEFLEEHLPSGCAICETWGAVGHSVVVDDEDEINQLVDRRPETCPSCGRHVPVELNRTIVLVCGISASDI